MAFYLYTLVMVQIVSLHKQASALSTFVVKVSNDRRLQQFFAKYILGPDMIVRMIFSFLPVKTDLILSINCTSWSFGVSNNKILMRDVIYKYIAFHLIFNLFPKRYNSNWKERKNSWNGSSDFLGLTVLTVLWLNVSSKERKGSYRSTMATYGIISGYLRTTGLSNDSRRRKSEPDWSSINSGLVRRNSITASSFIKDNMSILQQAYSKTPMGFLNSRFSYVSIVRITRLHHTNTNNDGRLKWPSRP